MKESINEPLYMAGDFVLIEKIFVVDTTLRTIPLDEPIVAKVIKNKGNTSLGYAYVLDFTCKPKRDDLAKVCYWEDDILCKTHDPDEYLWRVWGDQ